MKSESLTYYSFHDTKITFRQIFLLPALRCAQNPELLREKKNTKKSKHSASLVISALRKQPLFSTNRAYCWVLRLPRWRTAHSGSCSHQTPSWKWKAGRRFCSLDAHSGWTEGGGKHRTKVFRIYNTCLNKSYIWKKLIQSSLVLYKKNAYTW